MPPSKTTKRKSRSTAKSSRAKKLNSVYKDEFDDMDEGSESSSSFKSPKSTQKSMGKTVFISLIIGIFIGGGLALFFNQQQQDTMNDQMQADISKDANRPLEQRVADLVRHQPEDQPVIAMVKDVSLIQDIPLYQFAQNGDKVVVYKDMTIIYDEKLDKVVSVVPQNILKEQVDMENPDGNSEGSDTDSETSDTTDESTDGDTATEGSTSGDTSDSSAVDPKSVTVEVRNGTKTAGLAGKRSREITKELGYTTTAANAGNSNYEEGIIVDLSAGKMSAEVAKLGEQLGIKKIVTEMPSGEAKSTSNIVVILAK